MKTPEVKFTKNGYEIRTEILEMARQFVEFEFSSKFAGWSTKVEHDADRDQVVTTVDMPQVPGIDAVLDAAEKMYNFVNRKTD